MFMETEGFFEQNLSIWFIGVGNSIPSQEKLTLYRQRTKFSILYHTGSLEFLQNFDKNFV